MKKILDEVYSQVRDYDFTYAHSSYIVNLWHVTSIDEEEELLTLDTGEQLGISRSKRDGLVQIEGTGEKRENRIIISWRKSISVTAILFRNWRRM